MGAMRALIDAPHGSTRVCALAGAVVLGVLFAVGSARAEVAEPSGRADQAFDFMNLLSHHRLHDLGDEDWNAYGQVTDIWTQKFGFPAKYTNCLPTSVTGCSCGPGPRRTSSRRSLRRSRSRSCTGWVAPSRTSSSRRAARRTRLRTS